VVNFSSDQVGDRPVEPDPTPRPRSDLHPDFFDGIVRDSDDVVRRSGDGSLPLNSNGEFAGANVETEPQKSGGISSEKSGGISIQKPGGISTVQQLTEKMPPGLPAQKPAAAPALPPAVAPANLARVRPADFFRYELDIRRAKRGFNVAIRKRLRWSTTRLSRQVAKGLCPTLTDSQVTAIRAGRFPKAITQAILQNEGNITHEHIKLITNRSGRGIGLRFAELDPRAKFLLARFERLFTGSDRPALDPTRDRERGIDSQTHALSDASGADFETAEPVPYVH